MVMKYKIHPIVMGTKIFDKSMMTYQFNNGKEFTIPIYCWYIEGGDQKILVDTGEMSPIQSENREKAVGGKIYTFEQGLAKWKLRPEDIDRYDLDRSFVQVIRARFSIVNPIDPFQHEPGLA